MDTINDGADAPIALRPWVDHYPQGIPGTPDRYRPVHEQVLAACAKNPIAMALDFLGGTTSFGELAKSITAFAGALQKPVRHQEGQPRGADAAQYAVLRLAYYAVLRAGGTVVNCNPLYTVHELSHITANAGADMLVTLDLKQMFEKAEALVEAGHVKTSSSAISPTRCRCSRKFSIRIAKRKDLADAPASRVADRSPISMRLIARNETPTPVIIDAKKDVAVQQYTGGTTGLPKGAMLSHANIAANMSQIDKWGCGLFYPPCKVVAVLPFFHIFAMTVCMNVPLCNGTQVVMLPRFELKALLALLVRTGANVLPAVPTLLRAIARADKVTARADRQRSKSPSRAAPRLPNEIRAEFAKKSKALLAEGYGLTEASPVVCCAALRVPSKPMSIGLPLPATDMRFVDVDSGTAGASSASAANCRSRARR